MNLNTNQLFAMALQLGPEWKVVESKLEGDPMSLEIRLDFVSGSKFPDPDSGVLCPVHDTKEHTWRHLNFWQYQTHLSARVPRIMTPEGKVRLIEVPWARPGSGFTLLFEAIVLLMAQQMPLSRIAELLGEEDTRLWRIVRHHVETAHQERDWSGVSALQVDETSSRSGHRYVTTIVDAHTHELLFMAEGKGVEGLQLFAQELSVHGGDPARIELISMDMSPAFIAGARTYFPQATIVFDHFHIALLAGKAFDKVRKALRREGVNMEKGLWALRGNAVNRTQEQLELRQRLCRQIPKLGRAMFLKEGLQTVLSSEDIDGLRYWCWRAKMSRLEPFRKLAYTLEAHWDGVVAFMNTRMTNAAIEAVNGVLQLAKRIARGFRSLKYFMTIAYLRRPILTITSPLRYPLDSAKRQF